MARFQLFEWEDQPWFPKRLRHYMVDYLDFLAGLSAKPFEAIAAKIGSALDKTKVYHLVDLCSGSGGPIEQLLGLLRTARPPTVVLTDLFPNTAAFERVHQRSQGRIGFERGPVDAGRVPERLTGFRTLFNSFHHFKPVMARRILRDCVDKRQGIAVVEVVSRSAPAILSVIINSLLLFLVTPFIKPFSPGRLIFTYLVPAVPACILWDGLVSCLRVYSLSELDALIEPDMRAAFEWETGKCYLGNSPFYVTYLIGVPGPG